MGTHMPRHSRTRWVIVVTANDNGSSAVYGSFYDYEAAHKIADRMSKQSAYYNVGSAVAVDEAGSIDEGFTVEVSRLQPFTSMKRFLEGE